VGYEGQPIRQPYPRGGYGSGVGELISNWQGPNLFAERGGTLYFVDANATWQVRPDLSLSAEVLWAKTLNWEDPNSWCGAQALINFNVTDQLAVYGRVSFLNDPHWLVTGARQRVYESSWGVTYRIYDKFEWRAEYRHDHSTAFGDVNSASIDMTIGF
jgi:hypothetical protein